MNRTRSSPSLALASLCAAVLAACGGGGSSEAPPPVAPTSVTISGIAADGPLQGATACYDLNDNGACDGGEPSSAPTDADGNFSFDVDAAAAGQHRVVVVVPATAIDKDTGAAVGTAFTLQSPATGTTAAHSVFVSPLTTLVQAHVDATGATVSAATDYVQTQAALAVSPLADYTQASGADAKQAATVAHLVVLTQQQQAAALASVVGQVDVSGATITEADVDKAALQAVLGALSAIAASTLDASVTGAATTADLMAALNAAAQNIVATQTGLNASTAAAKIGVDKLPPDTSTPTSITAGATLRALTYADANNWYYRAMESSVADNTVDANNLTHFYDVRQQSSVDVFGRTQIVSWGSGSSVVRAGDQHWNGSAWVACSLGFRSESSPRDPQGRNNYNYCDHYEDGSSQRSGVDVSGQSIKDVIANTVRTFPGSDSGVAYAAWGPSNLDLLGSATFPAGSTLWYYTNHALKTAFAYDVQPTNIVSGYPADIAAGGDTRTTSGLACAQVNSSNSASFFKPVVTLDTLIARNSGTPCVFAKGTNADGSSLDSNEWWSNSTVSLGSVSGAAVQPSGTGNYYSTTALLRVSFTGSGNGTMYWSCLQRHLDGSPRNCTQIGSGSYAIQTLGDARAMSFTGLPALTQSTGFTRVFVERGGQVYFGYQNPTGQAVNSLRFNLTAGNAILSTLGLQPMAPVPPASAADSAKQALMATAKGAWISADGSALFRFGDGGQFLMGQTSADTPSTQPGVERGMLDIDPATGSFHSLVEVDSNWEAGTSHPQAGETLQVSASQISSNGGAALTRLVNDPNGIVGLWAVDSATDLKAVHLAFFGDGRVMLIDSTGETDVTGACYVAHQGPPGVELASYTFDAASGALHVFNKQVDTNGCGGIFDSSQGALQNGTANTTADFVVTFSADKKSATTDTGATLYRIAPQ